MGALDAHAVSGREHEVLDAVAEHLTNAEIARRLHISIRTVESHVAALLRKLQAADRRELARLAPALGPKDHAADVIAGVPTSVSSFVGRAREIAGLRQLLDEHRLLTLVGPGGVGKTRLAVEVARTCDTAAWARGGFVDLVPVAPDFVTQAVAAVLGVGQRPEESLEEALLQRIGGSRCLLVLDNCEHLLAPAAALALSVVEACPQAVVLATSRQRLDLPGERVFAVAPLGLVPDAQRENAAPESVTLFAERSGRSSAGDEDRVLEICRRLEGMPLAIELAAARADSLGLDGLLAGLDDHLRLLTRSTGDEMRHSSLRAVIEWSHHLLHDDERMLFRRLGAFQGAFDLAAAHRVGGTATPAQTGDLVGRLADQSLLIRSDERSGSRWRMLDSIRAFARDRLAEADEYEETLSRHREWAAGEAQSLAGAVHGTRAWWDSFDAVADDLRSAVRSSEPGSNGFSLAMALARLTFARRYLAETRDHLRTAVELAPDEAAAVSALRLAAGAAFSEMRGELSYSLLLEAAARAQAAGDTRTAAVVLAQAAGLAARCPALFVRSLTLGEVEELIDRARALERSDDLELETHLAIAEAWALTIDVPDATTAPATRALDLARRTDDPRLISIALDALTAAHIIGGSHRDAARVTRERVGLLDRLPREDPTTGGEVVDIFHMATETAIATGALGDALAVARRHVDDEAAFGLAHFAATNLVISLALKGEFDDAVEQALVMLSGWEDAGRPPAAWMGPSFHAAALVHGLRGGGAAYEEWRGHARRVSGGGPSTDFARYVHLRVALHNGDLQSMESESSAPTSAYAPHAPYTAAVRAEAAALAGWADRDDQLASARRGAEQNDFVAAHVARVEGRIAGDQRLLTRSVHLWETVGARFERACTLFLLADRTDEGREELAALGCDPPRGPLGSG